MRGLSIGLSARHRDVEFVRVRQHDAVARRIHEPLDLPGVSRGKPTNKPKRMSGAFGGYRPREAGEPESVGDDADTHAPPDEPL